MACWYPQAVASYNRAIDFADSREKLTDYINIAACSIEQGQWPNVDTIVFKLRNMLTDDPMFVRCCACAAPPRNCSGTSPFSVVGVRLQLGVEDLLHRGAGMLAQERCCWCCTRVCGGVC